MSEGLQLAVLAPAEGGAVGESLDQIEARVREWHPQCRAAFTNFLAFRFLIGRELLKAKALIPTTAGGDRTGDAEQKRNVCVFAPEDGPEAAKDGFLVWKRSVFPNISMRTLDNYTAFARQVISHHPSFDQLDLFNVLDHEREAIYTLLKTFVNSRDITLALRSMREIDGADENPNLIRARAARGPSDPAYKLENIAVRMARTIIGDVSLVLTNHNLTRIPEDVLEELLDAGIKLNNAIRNLKKLRAGGREDVVMEA